MGTKEGEERKQGSKERRWKIRGIEEGMTTEEELEGTRGEKDEAPVQEGEGRRWMEREESETRPR